MRSFFIMLAVIITASLTAFTGTATAQTIGKNGQPLTGWQAFMCPGLISPEMRAANNCPDVRVVAPLPPQEDAFLANYLQMLQNMYPDYDSIGYDIRGIKTNARQGMEIRSHISLTLYWGGFIASATDDTARAILTSVQQMATRGQIRPQVLAILKRRDGGKSSEELVLVNNQLAARCNPTGEWERTGWNGTVLRPLFTCSVIGRFQ